VEVTLQQSGPDVSKLTSLLQVSYKSLTSLLKVSYKSFTSLLHDTYKSLTSLLQVSHKSLTSLLQVYYKSLTSIVLVLYIKGTYIGHGVMGSLVHGVTGHGEVVMSYRVGAIGQFLKKTR
jgi:hypothetical protein